MSATADTRPGRRLPVPPRSRTVGSLVTMAVVIAVVVGLHVVAVHETQFSLPELASGWRGIWQFLFGSKGTATIKASAGALPPVSARPETPPRREDPTGLCLYSYG